MIVVVSRALFVYDVGRLYRIIHRNIVCVSVKQSEEKTAWAAERKCVALEQRETLACFRLLCFVGQ